VTSLVVVVAAMMAGALADDAAFVEGRRLYEASEYEQATFRFQEAALVATREPGEKAQVFMWLGLAYAGFGDAESARRAFRDAFRIDATVAVPVEISPKVEAEIAAVRGEVQAEVAARDAALKEERDAPPPPPPPPPVDDGAWVVPAAVGVTGTACVVGGVIAAGLAASSHARAVDLETFQDEVPGIVATRDTQAAIAAGLVGVGVVLVGVAVFIALAE
jgi:tetratricopeptide (TPR) repeat protein